MSFICRRIGVLSSLIISVTILLLTTALWYRYKTLKIAETIVELQNFIKFETSVDNLGYEQDEFLPDFEEISAESDVKGKRLVWFMRIHKTASSVMMSLVRRLARINFGNDAFIYRGCVYCVNTTQRTVR